MRGSGGTDGGTKMFTVGVVMAVTAVYLFFDSVRVATGHSGAISGMLGGGAGRGRMMETTSMGILFVPFFLGVFSLFVDARRKWAWWLSYLGIAILAIEVLSRVRFIIDTKLTSMLLMFVLFAAGCAFMFRSYRPSRSLNLDDLDFDRSDLEALARNRESKEQKYDEPQNRKDKHS